MEALAYVHLALNYETEVNEPQFESPPLPKTLGKTARANGLGILSCWSVALLGVTVAIPVAIPQAARAVLQPGDRSLDVKEAQLRLQQLGYFNARATGYYGSITRASVQRFQRDRGLATDGILGDQTHSALVESQPSVIAQNSESATYLTEGSQGEAVRSLQQRLRALGFYQGEITGNFEATTKDAVIRFQQAQGLTSDGVVGPRTFAVLSQANTSPQSQVRPNETTEPNRYLAQGDQGAAVRSLQHQLRSLGYYLGEITETFDSATQDAIITFQLDHGLEPDGVVGSRTLAALNSATPIPKAPQQLGPTNTTEVVPANPNQLSPEQVKELQQRLQELGFYQGQVDGLWGTQTQTALENAQRFYGVSQEDIIRGQ